MLSFDALVQLYTIQKPIKLIRSESQGVVATKKEIEIYTPNDIDLPELLALAKLGEQDHLLTTFYFQPDLTEKEEKLCKVFYNLCMPLQTLWTWDIMFNFLPRDEFIEQLREPIEIVIDVVGNEGVLTSKDVNYALIISFMLIVEKYGNLIDEYQIDFKMVGKYLDEYISLTTWTRRFAKLNPNVDYYIELAKNIGFEGEVKIIRTDDEVDYYLIRAK